MLVTPISPLGHFMSIFTMEGLTTNFKFRTSMMKVFIGLNNYFKFMARVRSMAAFTILRPMSLVSQKMVLQWIFLISKKIILLFLLAFLDQ